MATPDLKRLRQFKLITFVFVLLFFIPLFILINRLNDSRDMDYNESINQRNVQYADSNSFCFTDRDRQFKKPEKIFRIAVLGDSYIWGDGIPYEKIWSHKLEKKLLDEYDSLEVLHWGQCGWSTLDEVNFFKQHGKDFDIDLLLIGWVENDPDVGNQKIVSAIKAWDKYPNLSKISRSFAQKLIYHSEEKDYSDWMDYLYTPQNLKDYQTVLQDFHNYIVENNVNVLFVMTPGPFSSIFDGQKKRFKIIEPFIINANFQCLDLYGPCEKKLGHFSSSELQANRANGHPGELMTEEFAVEVKTYLEQNKYLSKLSKKAK